MEYPPRATPQIAPSPPRPPRPTLLRGPEYVEISPTTRSWRWQIDLHDGSPTNPSTRIVYGSEARAERIAKRIWHRHVARSAARADAARRRRTVASR